MGLHKCYPPPKKVKLPSAEAGCRGRQRQDVPAGYDASLRAA